MYSDTCYISITILLERTQKKLNKVDTRYSVHINWCSRLQPIKACVAANIQILLDDLDVIFVQYFCHCLFSDVESLCVFVGYC